jgi:hypothetical protein
MLPTKFQFIWPSGHREEDLLEISVTSWPNELKFSWKHSWKVFYKDCSFSPDPLADMATTGNSCF